MYLKVSLLKIVYTKTVLIAKWLLYSYRVSRRQATCNQPTFLLHLTVCEVNMLPYMVCWCGVGEQLSTFLSLPPPLPHTGTQCAVMMCADVPLTLELFPDITHICPLDL